MAWSSDDLEKIEAAIAEGALRVKYKDKEVEYRSLREMLQVRDLIKASIGGKKTRGTRLKAEFDKGLC